MTCPTLLLGGQLVGLPSTPVTKSCTHRPPAFSFPSGLKSSACHPSSPHPSNRVSWIFQIQTVLSASIQFPVKIELAHSFHPRYLIQRGCRRMGTRRCRAQVRCGPLLRGECPVIWSGSPKVKEQCMLRIEVIQKRPMKSQTPIS